MAETTLLHFDFAGFVKIGWFTAITLIIMQIIQTALVDDPPANMKDGGAIRAGFNSVVNGTGKKYAQIVARGLVAHGCALNLQRDPAKFRLRSVCVRMMLFSNAGST